MRTTTPLLVALLVATVPLALAAQPVIISLPGNVALTTPSPAWVTFAFAKTPALSVGDKRVASVGSVLVTSSPEIICRLIANGVSYDTSSAVTFQLDQKALQSKKAFALCHHQPSPSPNPPPATPNCTEADVTVTGDKMSASSYSDPHGTASGYAMCYSEDGPAIYASCSTDVSPMTTASCYDAGYGSVNADWFECGGSGDNVDSMTVNCSFA